MNKVFLYHHDNKDNTGVDVFIDIDKYRTPSGKKVNRATVEFLSDILDKEELKCLPVKI